jgi:hypothetical protein
LLEGTKCKIAMTYLTSARATKKFDLTSGIWREIIVQDELAVNRFGGTFHKEFI